MKVHRAHEVELDFLKRRVDTLIDEENRTDPHPNVKQDLLAARSELNQFVNKLRKEGYHI
jgi:tmRNA-binding protein